MKQISSDLKPEPVNSSLIQPEIKIGQSMSVKKADSVTNRVMKMNDHNTVQMQPEEEKEGIQMQAVEEGEESIQMQPRTHPLLMASRDEEEENTAITPIRPKLQIGESSDKYEQEADSVADRIMRLNDHYTARIQPLKKMEESINTERIQLENNDEERNRYLRELQGKNPFSVPESEIQQTKEYKSYMNPNGVYRKDMSVTTQEAILACRLILVDIAAGTPPKWKTMARIYITEARRRLLQKLPKPEKGSKTFLQTLYAMQDSPPGAFNIKLMAQTLKAILPMVSFRELHIFLSDPVRKAILTQKLGVHAEPLLVAMLERQHAIIIERYRKYQKEYSKGKDPAGIKPWITMTGVFTSKDNPFWNITREALKAVYNASLVSGSEPSVLLALWKKEGKPATSTKNIKSGVNVGSSVRMTDYDSSLGKRIVTVQIKTPAQARAYVRSRIYYIEFGSDHFTAFKRVPSDDNILDPDLDKHDPAMAAAMNKLAKAGYLRKNLTVKLINNELAVTTLSGGGFKVEPTQKFYELSLELNSAYFQYLKATKFSKLGNKSPSTVLNYAHWNMGTKSFKKNLLEWGNKQSGFTGAKLEKWILERRPDPYPKGQVRRNVIRFGIYEKAYQLLFK